MYHTVTSRLRLILALTTLCALLAVPLQAFAAKGTNVSGASEAVTPLAATDGLLAFRVSLTNSGNSTLTQFRFDGTVEGAAAFHSASSSDCSFTGGTVSCVRGTGLASGQSQVWLLVFSASSSAGNVTLTDGAFRADAKSGTPGAKQDTWVVPDRSVQVLDGDNPDFFSALVLDGAGFQTGEVGTDQTTRLLDIPGQGNAYGVSVWQNDADVACGDLDYFGRTVDINVANGESPVTVVITFGRISGLTPAKVGILHDCEPVPADCVASPDFCQSAQYVGNGSNRRVQVTVHLPHNGSIKGFL